MFTLVLAYVFNVTNFSQRVKSERFEKVHQKNGPSCQPRPSHTSRPVFRCLPKISLLHYCHLQFSPHLLTLTRFFQPHLYSPFPFLSLFLSFSLSLLHYFLSFFIHFLTLYFNHFIIILATCFIRWLQSKMYNTQHFMRSFFHFPWLRRHCWPLFEWVVISAFYSFWPYVGC